MSFTTTRFPKFEPQLKRLTEQHLALEHEPLHLALTFDSHRSPEDIFLLEVVGDFAGNEINPEGDFFEVSFPSSESFPMDAGQRLHLILTSPDELDHAVSHGWRGALEIRDAVRQGKFEILHKDDVGERALGLLR